MLTFQPLQRLRVQEHACLLLDHVLRHSVQPMQDSAKQDLELKDLAFAQQLQKEEDSSPKSVLDQFASSSTQELTPPKVGAFSFWHAKSLCCSTYVSTADADLICMRGATCHSMLYAGLCQVLAVVKLLGLSQIGSLKVKCCSSHKLMRHLTDV